MVRGRIVSLASQTSASPRRVLICSKDQKDRGLIEKCLKKGTGGEVVSREVDQVCEAKIAADRGEVDLVVVDVDMPDWSGYWLEKILQNQLVPVVALTGQDGQPETRALWSRRPLKFVSKIGLSSEALNEAADTALRKWQALRRNEVISDELEHLASYDYLTGLLNRRALLRRLGECIARSRYYGEETSLVLFDVDRVGWLSETVARSRVDVALQRVAGLLQRTTRETDFVGRSGLDEFAQILPHTGRDSARIAAERIRKMVQELEFDETAGKVFGLSLSSGVAQYQPGDDVAALMYRAEGCLCQARDRGMNRVA